MFFGAYRGAFLEFLRNLTPQIVLLIAAFVAGSRLNLQSIEATWTGVKNAAAFWLCLVLIFGSFMANATQFVERVVTSTEALDIEVSRIRARSLSGGKLVGALLGAAWRHNKAAFWNLALTFVIAETGFVVVGLMAMQGAVAALKALRQ